MMLMMNPQHKETCRDVASKCLKYDRQEESLSAHHLSVPSFLKSYQSLVVTSRIMGRMDLGTTDQAQYRIGKALYSKLAVRQLVS